MADLVAGVLISVNGAVEGITSSLPEIPSVGVDFAAVYASAAKVLNLDYLYLVLEATYLSGAGLFMEGGFFLEYSYALAAIACAMVFISLMWYSFRAHIVSLVDAKMPNSFITYSATELADKLGRMSGVSVASMKSSLVGGAGDKDEKKSSGGSMKMKTSMKVEETSMKTSMKTSAGMKKSPAKSMAKSRGKTPTPSKKSPAKSMKKA